jgi:hypothetical protein
MPKRDRVVEKIMSGASDANVTFDELRRVLIAKSFDERIRGDHHIFTKDSVEEIINLQPLGGMAKAYQVKQVRALLARYKLGTSDE